MFSSTKTKCHYGRSIVIEKEGRKKREIEKRSEKSYLRFESNHAERTRD
jgi:hypothetical protein